MHTLIRRQITWSNIRDYCFGTANVLACQTDCDAHSCQTVSQQQRTEGEQHTKMALKKNRGPSTRKEKMLRKTLFFPVRSYIRQRDAIKWSSHHMDATHHIDGIIFCSVYIFYTILFSWLLVVLMLFPFSIHYIYFTCCTQLICYIYDLIAILFRLLFNTKIQFKSYIFGLWKARTSTIHVRALHRGLYWRVIRVEL